MPSLAIVVATAPERGDFERAEKLALAARQAGVAVGMFLMTGAASWAADERVARLLEEGCEVVVCGTSFVPLGRAAVPGVVIGSQDDHAALVHAANRVVALT